MHVRSDLKSRKPQQEGLCLRAGVLNASERF